MIHVHLRFSGVEPKDLATLLAAASKHRAGFPDYNHNAMHGVPVWAPVVHCEGRCFTVIFPPCDAFTAMAITNEGCPIPTTVQA